MASKLKIYALKYLRETFVVDKGVLATFTFKDVMDMVAKSICNLSVFARFADDLNWDHVVRTMTMSEAMINRFADYLDWDLVAEHQHLSEAFIDSHSAWLNVHTVSYYQQLSFNFVQTHYIELDWFFSKRQYLWSDEQLAEYIETRPNIWRYQHFSEEFITRNIARVDWMALSAAHRQWSDEFFSRHFNRFNKVLLVSSAILNNTQIERLIEVDHRSIIQYQVLSDATIRKYSRKLKWCWVAAYQALEPAMIEYIQAIREWTAHDRFQFSREVTDYDKLRQFPLLCDWPVLSHRRYIPESILVENEDDVVWLDVRIPFPSDTFLAANHHRLDPHYISRNASEQFLSSHPVYITSDTLWHNKRIISMSFLFNHINVFGRRNVARFPGISVNLAKKIRNSYQINALVT